MYKKVKLFYNILHGKKFLSSDSTLILYEFLRKIQKFEMFKEWNFYISKKQTCSFTFFKVYNEKNVLFMIPCQIKELSCHPHMGELIIFNILNSRSKQRYSKCQFIWTPISFYFVCMHIIFKFIQNKKLRLNICKRFTY